MSEFADDNTLIVESRFVNQDLESIAFQDFTNEMKDDSDEEMAHLLGY